MPLTLDGVLLAKVAPEVLIAEKKEELGLNDIKRLTKEAELVDNSGSFEIAINLWKLILKIEIKNLGKNHIDVGRSYNEIAILYSKLNRNNESISYFQKALAIHETQLGRNDQDTISVLNNLSQAYMSNDEYGNANKVINRCLLILEKNKEIDNTTRAHTFFVAGSFYYEKGMLAKSEKYINNSYQLNLKTNGLNHLNTLTTLNWLADIYFEKGDYGKAKELYKKVFDGYSELLAKDNPKIFGIMSDIADTDSALGNSGTAITIYNKIIQNLENTRGKDNADLAIYYTNLAFIYDEIGIYYKAQPLYEKALKINKNVFGKNHSRTVNNLNNLGVLLLNQGQYEKAKNYLEDALDIEEEIYGVDSPNLINTLDNLSQTYYELENYKLARTLIDRAYKIASNNLSLNDPTFAITLNNLASFYEDDGDSDKAISLYKQALSIDNYLFGSDSVESATVMNNLGQAYLSKKDFNKALKFTNESLQIRKNYYGINHPLTALSFNNMAGIYRDLGEHRKANNYARKGLEIEFFLMQREAPFLIEKERLAFIESFGWGYDYAFSRGTKSLSGTELAYFVRLNRQGLLEDIEKYQAEVMNLPGEHFALVEKFNLITEKLSSTNISKSQRKDLYSQKINLEREVYRLLPELKPRIVQADQVSKALPLDSVLIEYQLFLPFDETKPISDQWSEHRYIAFVLKPNRQLEAIDLGTAVFLESKIQNALLASEQGLADAQILWKDVSDLVVKPLKEAIGGAETLFISPDEELNRIPFAALSSPKGDELLGDAVNIRLLTTGRELLELAKESKPTKQRPLVIANPAFNLIKDFSRPKTSDLIASNTSQQRSGDLASFNWSPLPGTAKEGKEIAQLTKAQLLTKNKATALAVQKQQEAPKVLHIASHAYFLPDQEEGENPLLRSGIVLAGANEPKANPEDDGYLTALEVTKLDWQGTELAVISGCESGKGQVEAGEGVYGLKRAIAVAGARSSLLSLWKVDDRATAAFMTSFYKKLKAGDGRADALSATQKEFRNHSIPGWRHPYVWAAFQLSGDWRPIDW